MVYFVVRFGIGWFNKVLFDVFFVVFRMFERVVEFE